MRNISNRLQDKCDKKWWKFWLHPPLMSIETYGILYLLHISVIQPPAVAVFDLLGRFFLIDIVSFRWVLFFLSVGYWCEKRRQNFLLLFHTRTLALSTVCIRDLNKINFARVRWFGFEARVKFFSGNYQASPQICLLLMKWLKMT